MKNWQRYLILAGAAMSRDLSKQEIQDVIDAIR